MTSCNICNKNFFNKFSKDRHDSIFHENDDNDDDDNDDDTTESTDGEESGTESVISDEDSEDNADESEGDSEVGGIEQAIIDTTIEYGSPEFGANGELQEPELTQFIQSLEETVENAIEYANQLKDSALYQQIQKTAQNLKQKNGFSDCEAREYAWNKRRFLLKDLIQNVTNNMSSEYEENAIHNENNDVPSGYEKYA